MGVRGASPPCCWKSTVTFSWLSISEVLYLRIQPTDCGSTLVFTIRKKSLYKWTCAVQTCYSRINFIFTIPKTQWLENRLLSEEDFLDKSYHYSNLGVKKSYFLVLLKCHSMGLSIISKQAPEDTAGKFCWAEHIYITHSYIPEEPEVDLSWDQEEQSMI